MKRPDQLGDHVASPAVWSASLAVACSAASALRERLMRTATAAETLGDTADTTLVRRLLSPEPA